jgi:ATP-binding protein involved in chromosome partitioning
LVCWLFRFYDYFGDIYLLLTNKILSLIDTVLDPLLGLSAEAMGFKLQITEKGKEAGKAEETLVELHAGFPTDTLKSTLLPALDTALKQAFPSESCHLALNSFIEAHRTQMLGKALRSVKNTIAIASGKGGVGKSTVTVNLAAALAKAGARVGILDADIYGPSVPMMLGEHKPVVMEGERYAPVQAHQLSAMSIGYLTAEGQDALIWRGPMLAKALLQMLDITAWDNLDYLFIDLPPGTGDIPLSLVQKIPLTAAIVVTTPQQISTLDAEKAIKMFQRTGIDVLGVVENMSYHHCSHCGHEDLLFGQGGGKALTERYDLPFLGQLPLNSQIQRLCDEGKPAVLYGEKALADAFMKVALQAAQLLAKKPLNYAGKFPPVVIE